MISRVSVPQKREWPVFLTVLFLFFCVFWFPNVVQAQARPDLTVDVISVSDNTPNQAQTIQLLYRVRNGGTATASNVTVRFYYSEDNTITTSDKYLAQERTFAAIPANTTLPSSSTAYAINIQVPADAKVGTGYIGAIIDYGQTVTESNENNNTDSVQVTVGVTNNTVDLQISFLKIDKSTVIPGDKVTIEYRIYNAGAANVTTSFGTNVYLSTNDTISGGDTSLGGTRTDTQINGRAYLPSSSTTYTATVTIPPNASPGNYWIGVLTDYTGRVNEINNDNNFQALPLNIVSPLPELQVELVSVSDTTPTQGQTVAVTFRVKNVGYGTATNAVVRFYLSDNTNITTNDRYLALEKTYTLQGGQTLPSATTTYTENVTIPVDAPTGQRSLGAIIDYNNQITESDENNNTDLLAVTVGAANNTTDLQVEAFSVSTDRAKAGDQITVTYRIFNAGTANITTAFKTRIYLSTDSVLTSSDTSMGGDNSIASINARSYLPSRTTTYTSTFVLPTTVTAGSYYVGVLLDWENKVTENVKTNNWQSAPLTVYDNQPDLRIAITNLNVTTLNQGQSITVFYRTSNAGGSNAGAHTVRFYLSTDANITTSDIYLNAERAFTSLAANSSAPSATGSYSIAIPLPASAPVGSVYIGAIIDYDDAVKESNETNNTDSRNIVIRPANTVDLQVTYLTADKTTVTPGGQVTFDYRISNTGNQDVTGNFSVQVYRSSDATVSRTDTAMGGTQNFSGINGGQTLPSATTTYKVTITIPTNTPPGTYYFGPVVDYDLRIPETNEDNNGMGVRIVVASSTQPDLEMTSISIAPTTQLAGQNIAVTYTITNKGTASVASYTFRVYFSTDSTITTADRQIGVLSGTQLDAGKTYTNSSTITLPADLAASNGYIGIFIDPANAIAESNENNNTNSTPIKVVVDKDQDGVPSHLDCDDNDKTSFPAYNGKPAAPEICDGKDNDCNGQIDDNIAPQPCYTGTAGCTQQTNGSYQCKSPCKSGTRTCQNGQLGPCVGEILPKTEICNNQDDDCDGLIDNGGVCQEPTQEPSAEPTPDNNTTTEPTPDNNTTTEPTPDNNTTTEPTPDASVSEPTPDASTNDTPGVDIQPPDADCYIAGCPTGQICQQGTCIPDLCAGAQCQSNEVCKNGNCVSICACLSCPSTDMCVNGQCVADPCAGVQCANDESCDPASGSCVKDSCPTIRCAVGRVCILSQCVDDPCANIKCPAGNECRNGQCVGTNCPKEPGPEAVPEDETTTDGGTSETTADSGESVLPESGDDSVIVEVPGEAEPESTTPESTSETVTEATSETVTETTTTESTTESNPDGDTTDTTSNDTSSSTQDDSTTTDTTSSEKSGGDGSSSNVDTNAPPPGGCCEVGTLSTQASGLLLALLVGLFLLTLRRQRRLSSP